MKRKMTGFVALAVLAASCTREAVREDGGHCEADFFISASVGSIGPEEKAGPDAALQVVWQEGDRIGLVDQDGTITPATLDAESAGQPTGRFRYTAREAVVPVYAYYPFTGAETLKGARLTLSMQDNLVMAARPDEGGALVFQASCALVDLRVTGPEGTMLSSLSLQSREQALSGRGVLDLSADHPVFEPVEAGPGVTVALDLPVSAETAAPVRIYLPAGEYSLEIKASGRTSAGDAPVTLSYVSTVTVGLEAGHFRPLNVPLEEGNTTLYGQVLCEGRPVVGAVVSDGRLVTATDASGTWRLASDKKEGLVFVSIPSGYTVGRRYGAVPGFFHHTQEEPEEPERIDFDLLDDGDQTVHRIYLLGDVHGMFTNNAPAQFAALAADLDAQVAARPVQSVGVQLGDSTWDYIWYQSNPFKMPQYLEWADALAINVFNCMGNHDGDMYLTDDWMYGRDFRAHFGPTWYSFNMGQVHYVVLDDVVTCNDGTGTAGRAYKFGLTGDELSWLAADLSYVPKTTPVVVMYHVPMLGRKGTAMNSVANGNMALEDFIAPFRGFSDVRFYSAHTHFLFAASATVDGFPVHEQNVSAVCADFWGSGRADSRNLMCRDGSPAGYRILDVDGTSIQDVFRATGREDYLFRAYDRNCIHLAAETYVPAAGDGHRAAWEGILGEFASASTADYVYIYTWDWKEDWTLTVQEAGRILTPVEIYVKDPLYMVSKTVIDRCNKADNGSPYTLDMTPQTVSKVFRVQASSPSSTLVIRMADSYGHVRTEVMTRPKPFDLATYAAEGTVPGENLYTTPIFEEDEAMDL